MIVKSIPYTETGTKMTISLLVMGETGILVCTQDDPQKLGQGTIVDRAMCPCCMDRTQPAIMKMIREAGVKRVVWADSYAESDQSNNGQLKKYFPALSPVSPYTYTV